MSPGPSLALVMHHTFAGSRSHGVLVALGLSHPGVLERLRQRMQLLERLFGIVLIGVAVRLLLL